MASSRRRPWASLLIVAAVALASCSSAATGQPASTGPATTSRLAQPPGPTRLPTKDNELSDVTCPSPTRCMAAGVLAARRHALRPDTRTLIEADSDGAWR